MKKIIILFCAIFILITIALLFNGKNNSELKKIKVAEVTHSIFYTPMYVSDALGYFKDEGLDVEIILTSGADNVAAAVLSGDVQIGFCGSEQSIYIYNEGAKDYLVNFAGLTKRDGSFLVSRQKEDNFDLSHLIGRDIIGGRKGGMPAMTLAYTIHEFGIKDDELNIDTSIDFASMSGAFIGGTGDYVTLFEPNASQLEKQGYGYIVASVGELGGVVPYTAFNAKKSYIEKNPDVIESFTIAIQKGLDYTFSHSDEELAKLIADYFPDTSYNDLVNTIKNYRNIDSWFKTTYISKEGFNHIQEIMKYNKVLDKNAPYNLLVDNTYNHE